MGQRTAHYFQGARMIDRPITLAAARFIVSGKRRNAFEQRRFPGAVFTDDDRDRTVEVEREAVVQKRQAKRIGRRIWHTGSIEPHTLEVRRRQSDRAALHGADTSGEIISIATGAKTHGWERFTGQLGIFA
jgi:hypothetical protein